MIKNISTYILAGILLIFVFSCKGDKFDDSIFIDSEHLDPNSFTYEFDVWLYENYNLPYNLDFRYKMEDVGSDMDYNLVPTSLDNSEIMAKLIKYLWFEPYKEIVAEDFLKYYGPRIIHLIGSGAINSSLNTIVLGTAEGGIKITLYDCNNLDLNNISNLNENYFKTMHHEFAHILHQKRPYPKEYETYSAGYYTTNWYDNNLAQVAPLGFVSPYSRKEPQEDFVEVIANYIVKTDGEWNSILNAAKGTSTLGSLSLSGDSIIKIKLDMARDWLKDSWEINLDSLRANVQLRQQNIDQAFNE